MKNVELLRNAIELANNQNCPQVAELIKQYIRANESDVRIGKVSPYDFVANDVLRPIMCGVFHDSREKRICACDGYILYSCKDLYNEQFADKSVSKNGELQEGRYPNYMEVIQGFEKYTPKEFPISKDELLDYIKEYKSLNRINKYVKKDSTIIRLDGELGISIKYAEKLAKFDLTKTILRCEGKYLRAIMYQSGEEILLLMPQYVREENKANYKEMYYSE